MFVWDSQPERDRIDRLFRGSQSLNQTDECVSHSNQRRLISTIVFWLRENPAVRIGSQED
jgi:hypothetical protein